MKTVSILVLVDAALRLVDMDHPVRGYQSFNPCFSGCRPATLLQMVETMTTNRGFNPCFSGCRPATLLYGIAFIILIGFQSLF